MRIIHLLKNDTGAGWVYKMVADQVVNSEHEVHIVIPKDGGNAQRYRRLGCTVHILNLDFSLKNVFSCISKIFRFRRLVQRIEPMIVHSHFVSTTIIMRLALFGKKVGKIFQVPGPLHLEHFFYRLFEIGVSNKFDFWIASCEWTRERYIKSGIDSSRVFLSYLGTDIEAFNSNSGLDLREELSIDPNEFIVGMVAYMYPPKKYLFQSRGLKGHEDVIDALHILEKEIGNITVVFVGGEWGGGDSYFRKVKRYAKLRLKKDIKFLGNRADVVDLYPNFDISVCPSHSENVGSAVESLLMGVPTISSDVGGFPDLIKDMETGLTVQPKCPDQLAEAIKKYYYNTALSRQHSVAGKALAESLFDVKITAAEVLEIYREVDDVKKTF